MDIAKRGVPKDSEHGRGYLSVSTVYQVELVTLFSRKKLEGS